MEITQSQTSPGAAPRPSAYEVIAHAIVQNDPTAWLVEFFGN
jgi:hypothetical protein